MFSFNILKNMYQEKVNNPLAHPPLFPPSWLIYIMRLVSAFTLLSPS